MGQILDRDGQMDGDFLRTDNNLFFGAPSIGLNARRLRHASFSISLRPWRSLASNRTHFFALLRKAQFFWCPFAGSVRRRQSSLLRSLWLFSVFNSDSGVAVLSTPPDERASLFSKTTAADSLSGIRFFFLNCPPVSRSAVGGVCGSC